MVMWDNPRPKGYWPNTPSQWREPSVDDCTWYATEFLFEAASETHRSVHPVLGLRNDSIDKVGGTTLPVALSETMRLWPTSERVTYSYGSYTRDEIVAALLSGAGILWGGDYEKLPNHYRRWTNNDVFNHAMASLTLEDEDRTFLYDPLGGGPTRQPYDGEWITIDALLDFNWNAGYKQYSVGIVENLGEEPMRYLHLPMSSEADRVVGIRRGGAARVAPRITAAVKRKFWNEEKRWGFLGLFSGGWFLVLWEQDGEWDFGYVHREDIIANESVQVEPTLPEVSAEATELYEKIETALVNLNEAQAFLDDAREALE